MSEMSMQGSESIIQMIRKALTPEFYLEHKRALDMLADDLNDMNRADYYERHPETTQERRHG